MDIKFKRLECEHFELHKEFIYVALWDHPDDIRRPRSSLETSAVKAYYENWGKSDDLGYIAVVKGEAAGFVQVRIKESVTPNFSEYPELALSVLPKFQRKGIARRLCDKLITEIKRKYPGIRLGVNPKNEAAISLYRKLGFNFYASPKGGYPQMVLQFA